MLVVILKHMMFDKKLYSKIDTVCCIYNEEWRDKSYEIGYYSKQICIRYQWKYKISLVRLSAELYHLNLFDIIIQNFL